MAASNPSHKALLAALGVAASLSVGYYGYKQWKYKHHASRLRFRDPSSIPKEERFNIKALTDLSVPFELMEADDELLEEMVRMMYDDRKMDDFVFAGTRFSKCGLKGYTSDDFTKMIDGSRPPPQGFNKCDLYFERGCAFFDEMKFNEALEDFNTAISLDPYCAVFYSNKAAVYYAFAARHYVHSKCQTPEYTDNITKATSLTIKALSLEPLLVPAYLSLYSMHSTENQKELGSRSLEVAEFLKPDFPFLKLAQLERAIDQANIEEAFELTDQVAELLPNSPYVKGVLAIMAVIRGQYDVCSAILDDRMLDWKGLTVGGDLQVRDNLDMSERWNVEYMGTVYSGMATLYIELAMNDKAKYYAIKALEVNEFDSLAYLMLAKVAIFNATTPEELEEAQRYIETAEEYMPISQNRQNIATLFEIKALYLQHSKPDTDEALAAIEEALFYRDHNNSMSDSLFFHSRILESKGDIAGAKRDLELMLETKADDFRALSFLSMIHFQTGDIAMGEELLDKLTSSITESNITEPAVLSLVHACKAHMYHAKKQYGSAGDEANDGFELASIFMNGYHQSLLYHIIVHSNYMCRNWPAIVTALESQIEGLVREGITPRPILDKFLEYLYNASLRGGYPAVAISALEQMDILRPSPVHALRKAIHLAHLRNFEEAMAICEQFKTSRDPKVQCWTLAAQFCCHALGSDWSEATKAIEQLAGASDKAEAIEACSMASFIVLTNAEVSALPMITQVFPKIDKLLTALGERAMGHKLMAYVHMYRGDAVSLFTSVESFVEEGETMEHAFDQFELFKVMANFLGEIPVHDFARLLKTVCERHPSLYFAWEMLGELYQNVNNHAKAVQAFDRSLDAYPTKFYTYTMRSSSYLELRNTEMALKDANDAIRCMDAVKMQTHEPYFARYSVFAALNNYEKAYEDICTCIDIAPPEQAPILKVRRSFLNWVLGNPSVALEDMDSGFDVYPSALESTFNDFETRVFPNVKRNA